jgi:hypothetical protein
LEDPLSQLGISDGESGSPDRITAKSATCTNSNGNITTTTSGGSEPGVAAAVRSRLFQPRLHMTKKTIIRTIARDRPTYCPASDRGPTTDRIA